MNKWEILEKMKNDGMNDAQILDEIMQALSDDEAKENLEYIARMWDIDLN